MAEIRDSIDSRTKTQNVLQSTPASLVIDSRHVSEAERLLSITCPSRGLGPQTCTIRDEQLELLFKFEHPALFTSASVRRKLKDATNQLLLVIRHPKNIHTSVIESKDGAQVCVLKDHGKSDRREQTASVHLGDIYETIDIQDNAMGTKTEYRVQGQLVAELTLLYDGKTSKPLTSKLVTSATSTQWTLRMASGSDMAFFVILAFARIEIAQAAFL